MWMDLEFRGVGAQPDFRGPSRRTSLRARAAG